jgi:hypothetical protein
LHQQTTAFLITKRLNGHFAKFENVHFSA